MAVEDTSSVNSRPGARYVDASGDENIDGLLYGTQFKPDPGSSTTVLTYSFPTSTSQFSTDPDLGYGEADAEPNIGFKPVDAWAQGFLIDAVNFVETFADIDFVQVADGGNNAGTIRLAWSGIEAEDSIAWAYLPATAPIAGDIWLLSQNLGPRDDNLGSTIVHELGHALGLKHPHIVEEEFGALDPQYDGYDWTIMSYNSSAKYPTAIWTNIEPQTFMYFDIKALQYLYGENTGGPSASDTVYAYDLEQDYYLTIWDTGGRDSFGVVNGSKNVVINLTPGTWQNVGTKLEFWDGTVEWYDYNSVYIPPEAMIEDAFGADGADTLSGNSMGNLLEGNAGSDSLFGDAGDDTLVGGAGDDILTGGEGADSFGIGGETGGWGRDVITDFTLGVDKIDLSASEFSYYDLLIIGRQGNALITDSKGNNILLEGVQPKSLSYADFVSSVTLGTANGDTMVGTDGVDRLDGLGAGDRITGGNGADRLYGSGGNDTLSGGNGNDKLYGGTQDDYLDGGAGRDVLFGDQGSDTLNGGDGIDLVQYRNSNVGVVVDLATGTGSAGQAKGDVLISIENINGSRAADSITGNDEDNKFIGYGGWDTMNGAGGDDRIEGWFGKDVLDGGDGNDIVMGGRHDDTIAGGAGNDTLSGGRDNDVFVFAAGGDDDVITDFELSKDSLDFSATTTDFTAMEDVIAAATDTAAGVVIDLGGGDSVLLEGIEVSDLGSVDFIF